jgi:hypothetical protein
MTINVKSHFHLFARYSIIINIFRKKIQVNPLQKQFFVLLGWEGCCLISCKGVAVVKGGPLVVSFAVIQQRACQGYKAIVSTQ